MISGFIWLENGPSKIKSELDARQKFGHSSIAASVPIKYYFVALPLFLQDEFKTFYLYSLLVYEKRKKANAYFLHF